ncbi:hypothetical protein CT676_30900 [Bradyrhizobium sp. MOS001]|nr:hypothetical protein CT676_30900 [Bradyrhizobium sp. MOS001]
MSLGSSSPPRRPLARDGADVGGDGHSERGNPQSFGHGTADFARVAAGNARIASGEATYGAAATYPPLEGEGRPREARAGWGDLSTRGVFIAEGPSPHPAPHYAPLHAKRPSPSRGG